MHTRQVKRHAKHKRHNSTNKSNTNKSETLSTTPLHKAAAPMRSLLLGLGAGFSGIRYNIVWRLRLRVYGLWFSFEDLRFRVSDLGFGVYIV